MKKNMHPFDRIFRLLFAVVITILYFTKTIAGTPAIILGIAAIVLAVTALVNFCPLYAILGISTKKKQ